MMGQGQEDDEISKAAINDRETLANSSNGSKQKVIPVDAVETYVTEGFEFVSFYSKGDKAIVRLS